MKHSGAVWVALAVLGLARAGWAAEQARDGAAATSGAPRPVAAPPRPAAPVGVLPQLSHAPVSVAPAGETLTVTADIVHPELVRRALLLYRGAGEQRYREIEFRRGAPGPYVAVLPAEVVRAPELSYTIEIELAAGGRIPVFASRAKPQRVQVPEDGMDLIEQAKDTRLDHRRSVFDAGAEYVSFGTSTAQVPLADGTVVEQRVDDWYYRVEGGYTYRLLRTVSAFSIRVGVVRGKAPVPVRELVPGQDESERFDVGLNYGRAMVRFRLGDIWHLDGSVLANVTEVGFSAGTGATLHIGDMYGSKLSLGFETIQTFGTRFFSRVDIQAHERVRISPIVEVTDAPSADAFGVRLVGEVGVDLGRGFALAARGGYQARDATSGGPSGGGMLSYAF